MRTAAGRRKLISLHFSRPARHSASRAFQSCAPEYAYGACTTRPRPAWTGVGPAALAAKARRSLAPISGRPLPRGSCLARRRARLLRPARRRTRASPHLLTWDNIVAWPPPGDLEAPETLWHRDRDDRVPNEGEEVDSASDRAFAAAGETREGASEEEEEEEERFELNDAWLERFARTEIERRARAKERRKEARREERVVVPAAAAAAARVEKQLAERRERESATSAALQ